MKGKTRRIIASWLLLAVYLPILVFSSVHTHENQLAFENECVACVNHQPHAGHFSASMALYHSCLLCQFISLTYLAIAFAVVIPYRPMNKIRLILLPVHVSHGMKGIVGLRAPPVVLL